MKRSEINRILRENIAFLERMNFKLPPFAAWGPEEWAAAGDEYRELREAGLGWDITDFGSGDFQKVGLFLFTLRNGIQGKRGKVYAEKIMVVEENQVTPYHFHTYKMEDIINRGGGNLLVRLYNSTAAEELADTPVQVSSDGRSYAVPAGTTLCLRPGESITMLQRQYHSFWGEPGSGKVLVGEVSMANDDDADNRFLEPAGRFPDIEEDEPIFRCLVKDL